MRLTIRELTLPVWRTLPWRGLAASAALGLLLAGALRWGGGDANGWPALTLLRAAVLAHALGLTFLLDDPARHTTATVPTRRALRTGLRIALVTPLTALWWTAVVLLVPSDVRPPVGDVTLEAAAACVLALLAGAVALRWTNEPRPGPSVAAAYLLTAVVTPHLLPAGWKLFVWPQDSNWHAAHERWAWLLAGAVVTLVACLPEPVRRMRIGRRSRTLSPSGV
ncbi:ABC transporter [Streptomyces gilvus]|uniref:ABC transporter n=1 Tax=Streptomyces gilvus TaxID=2920937 RepID=UPI001F0DF015|nr:ABC transporter [Streptomyces sp. CME 23]MCH5674791.1 ABC transporter [Streptomyces sp. CME 23]